MQLSTFGMEAVAMLRIGTAMPYNNPYPTSHVIFYPKEQTTGGTKQPAAMVTGNVAATHESWSLGQLLHDAAENLLLQQQEVANLASSSKQVWATALAL